MFILPIITNEHKKTLGGYLAGLIEGDGSIVIPLKIRNSANKLQHPAIKVSFPNKDFPFFTILTKIIGGKIQNTKGNYKIWAIQSKESLILIVNLINGQMRTPKVEALYRLIGWLHIYAGHTINKLPLDNSSLLYNSWLSGFIDSDGSFYCSFDLNKEGIIKNMRRYLSLSQRKNYHRDSEVGTSYEPLMTKIKETFTIAPLMEL